MFRRFVSSSSVLFGGRSAAIGRTAVGTIAAAAAAGAAITMAMANNTIVQAQSSSEVSSSNTADVEAPSNYPVNIDLNRFLPDRPPNLTLRGLLFVTRHGSRTPVSLLPGQTHDEFRDTWHNCPLGDHSTVPCSGGLLTHFGEFQLSSVGWHMRQRYVHTDGFLPTKFDSTFFQLRSTDLPRTQLSLARMLQGLYPSLSLETLGPLIEVRKQKDETMYPNHYFCPRLKEMYIEACHASRQSDPASYPAAGRYKSIADAPDAVALREKIALALKTTPEQLGTWVVIGDELKCRQSVGMKQVEGITQQMADRANELAEQTFWHIMRAGESADHDSRKPACRNSSDLLYTDKSPLETEVVRLGMGRLLKEMFTAMEKIKVEVETKDQTGGKKVSSSSSSHIDDTNASILNPPHTVVDVDTDASKSVPKCYMYSGHDTTIAPLLAGLHASHALLRPGSVGPGWPTLGSNMIIELLESTPSTQPSEDPTLLRSKEAATHRSLEQSLAPLPPSATEDDEHQLPKQQKETTTTPTKATTKVAEVKNEYQPHGGQSPHALIGGVAKKDLPKRIDTRSPLIVSPDSRWFIRLLVDHKEISILPYDEYQHLRKQYEVKDWFQECQQKSNQPLPPHRW